MAKFDIHDTQFLDINPVSLDSIGNCDDEGSHGNGECSEPRFTPLKLIANFVPKPLESLIEEVDEEPK